LYDFGNSDSHSNRIDFGDISALNAPTVYSTAFQLYVNAVVNARIIFSKGQGSSHYWAIGTDTSTPTKIVVKHYDGTLSSATSTGTLTLTTIHTVVVVWDGSNVYFYFDGVAAGSPALTRTPGSNSDNVTLGNHDSGASGAACRTGHAMWWDVALTAQEAQAWHGGMVCRLDALKFWAPCISDPGSDYWGGNAGTKSGSVSITDDFFATWYWPFDNDSDPAIGVAAAAPAIQIGDTPVVELDLPGATKYYGAAETNAHGLANYSGKLLQWGQIANGVSETSNVLARVETPVTIDDNDKEFAQLLEGSSGHQIRGCDARIKILGDGLDPYTRFAGKVDSWSQPEPHRYVINLRPNDTPLERKFPKIRITQFDWPDASPDVLGLYVPIIYGYHNSVGDTDEGMVPTLYVDTSGYVYLVAFGYLKEVTAVYVDGTKESASSYSITHPEVNGRQFTCIDFTSDQGSSIVTADVRGYENAGNGTGTLIESPVRQLEHLLENFVYGDYQTGSWLTGNAPIDDETFAIADNFMLDEGYEGSVFISDDQTKGRDFVNDWLGSWEMRAYWTREGNIGILALDHREKDLVISSPWIRWEQEDIAFAQHVEVSAIIDRLAGRHVKNSTDNQFKQSLEVRDPSIDEEASDSLDMEYGAARLA
jgi:hypothetical protein